MRNVVLLATTLCQFLAFSSFGVCQDALTRVKFHVTGFDLRGVQLHLLPANDGPTEFFVKAAVLYGEGALPAVSVNSIRSIAKFEELTIEGANKKELIAKSKNSAVTFSIQVPADASKKSIVLLLGRLSDNGNITAIVPFIAVGGADNDVNTIKVAVPKYEPSSCAPLVSTPCRPPVRVRPNATLCPRLLRRK